jgi:hypothetical protein
MGVIIRYAYTGARLLHVQQNSFNFNRQILNRKHNEINRNQ